MIDVAIWIGGWSLFLVGALRRKEGSRHLAGAINRCVNCGKKRPTMPYSDGWHTKPAPFCGQCIRDCVGVDQ